MRNYFINNFNDLRLREDSGFLFEGFVLSELIKKEIKIIRFWNDKNLEEVDFVLEQDGEIIPVEVKFKEDLKSVDFSGLNTFLNSYKKIKKLYLISLNKQKNEKKILLRLPYLVGGELSSE